MASENSTKKNLRIFFITHTYSLAPSGGGELVFTNFLKEMRRRGHEVFVFAPKAGNFSEKERALGINSFLVPVFGHHAFHKFEYLLFAGKAARLAQEFNADIIHAQNDVFPGLIGCFVKKRIHKPLVLVVEYLSDEAASLNLKLVFELNKILLPSICFDKIVAWSNCVKSFLQQWQIPAEKTVLIPGAIDMTMHLQAKPSLGFIRHFGTKTILSAKPLHKTNAEGISYIIRAMKIVSAKYPEYKYVILGDGNSRQQLVDLVKELDLEKNVLFVPRWFDSEELLPIYAAADIMAHSFVFKATTSASLLESMACGKPIVATDIGEIANVVKGSALLARPRDPESIASCILQLIENPVLKKQLGEKAQKIALENYSIQSVADRFEELYFGLLGKKA